jgi:hypothetical protein
MDQWSRVDVLVAEGGRVPCSASGSRPGSAAARHYYGHFRTRGLPTVVLRGSSAAEFRRLPGSGENRRDHRANVPVGTALRRQGRQVPEGGNGLGESMVSSACEAQAPWVGVTSTLRRSAPTQLRARACVQSAGRTINGLALQLLTGSVCGAHRERQRERLKCNDGGDRGVAGKVQAESSAPAAAPGAMVPARSRVKALLMEFHPSRRRRSRGESGLALDSTFRLQNDSLSASRPPKVDGFAQPGGRSSCRAFRLMLVPLDF